MNTGMKLPWLNSDESRASTSTPGEGTGSRGRRPGKDTEKARTRGTAQQKREHKPRQNAHKTESKTTKQKKNQEKSENFPDRQLNRCICIKEGMDVKYVRLEVW
jgi:hypothetical protein